MSRRMRKGRACRTKRCLARRQHALGEFDWASIRAKILPWLFIGGGILLVIGIGTGAAVVVYNVFKDRKEFVTTLWKALGAFQNLSRTTKLMIIAQAAHESGYGTGKAAKNGYNYWNITAGSQWKGDVIGGGDLECDAAGQNCKSITQKFRKYKSNVDAISDYLSFLSTQNGGRYKNAYAALLEGDFVAFLTELRARGYYTQALDEYIAGARGALNTVSQYV